MKNVKVQPSKSFPIYSISLRYFKKSHELLPRVHDNYMDVIIMDYELIQYSSKQPMLQLSVVDPTHFALAHACTQAAHVYMHVKITYIHTLVVN